MMTHPGSCTGLAEIALAAGIAVAFVCFAPSRGQAAEPAPLITAPVKAPPARNLDLRLGDLRRYVLPGELYAPLPDDFDEIVVRGRRRTPDIPDDRTIPQGLGSVFFALSRPLSAWRVLVPDAHYEVPKRDADTPKEPPGAWRMRLSPTAGSIFD